MISHVIPHHIGLITSYALDACLFLSKENVLLARLCSCKAESYLSPIAMPGTCPATGFVFMQACASSMCLRARVSGRLLRLLPVSGLLPCVAAYLASSMTLACKPHGALVALFHITCARSSGC